MPRNLELKARYPSADARVKARALSANYKGILWQTDTYFQVGGGRLKVRETRGKGAQLIWYQRPDRREERTSHYVIAPVDDPKSVKKMFRRLFGVKTVVRKKRILFLHKNARIHIDHVRGLGTFLEFEVLVKQGERQAQRLMRELRARFRIPKRALVSLSYSDLFSKQHRKKP